MRISSYLFLVVGLMILFNLAGLSTTAGYVLTNLDVVDNPENIALSAFVVTIGAVFVAAAVGGVVIGFFTKATPESYLLSFYSSILILFLSDIIVIVSTARSYGTTWAYWLVVLILLPVAVGFAHSVASWWGGKQA